MRLSLRGWIRYGAAALRGKALVPVLLFGLLFGGAAFAEDSQAPQELRVMAFGDSLMAGYGLAQRDGFIAQLGAWLIENGGSGAAPVRLINSSVSGSTTAGGLRRIDWALADSPDAMIIGLGGNDLLRGINPEDTRANLDGILSKADERGIEVLLVGLIARDNYGPEYNAAFNAIYPELAEEHGTLLMPDFFAALPNDPAKLAEYVQPDGTHPNARGVAVIVKDIGPKVQDLIMRSLEDPK